MKATATIFIFVLTITYCSAANPIDSTQLKTAPWFVEKFRVAAGLFVPLSNTNLQVGVKGGAAGTEIDFENDLGFNTVQASLLANFQWAISRRSRINVNYYNIPRSSTKTIDRTFTFDGQTYPANATVNSYFNTRIYQITYGYAIVVKPDFEIGVIIGTHLVDGGAGLSLISTLGSASADTDFNFIAPVPDLGVWGGYAFSDRFAVNFDIVYLPITVGDVSSRIISYDLQLMYKAIDKWDIALGYAGLNFNLDITKTNAEAHFKWGYNGPMLVASYSFGKKSWRHK